METLLFILAVFIVYWIFRAILSKNTNPTSKPKVKTRYEEDYELRKQQYKDRLKESRTRKSSIQISERKKTRYEKEREERQKIYDKNIEEHKKKNRIKQNKKRAAQKKKKIGKENNETQGGSGSGFLINNSGYVVTNYHVVGSNKKVKIRFNEKNHIGRVISIDVVNDLALIKITTKKSSYLKLANNDSDRLDNIITAGFPYGDSYSDHVKSTTGIVSAVVGPGNNTSQFQISAAIQPGNSGGPIIDGNNGSVVGVAVSKLDTQKYIDMYKSIPENVNFAIKSSTLKRFLKSNKIEYSASDGQNITNKEINELIDKAVLLIST